MWRGVLYPVLNTPISLNGVGILLLGPGDGVGDGDILLFGGGEGEGATVILL